MRPCSRLYVDATRVPREEQSSTSSQRRANQRAVLMGEANTVGMATKITHYYFYFLSPPPPPPPTHTHTHTHTHAHTHTHIPPYRSRFNNPVRAEQVRSKLIVNLCSLHHSVAKSCQHFSAYYYHNCEFVYTVDPPTFKSVRHSFNKLQAMMENKL